jgi:signal peptidase I
MEPRDNSNWQSSGRADLAASVNPAGSENPAVEDARSPEPVAVPAPRPRAAAHAALWMRDLILAACAAVFIIFFLFQAVRVEGTSMLPRLGDSDRVFINKFVYRLTSVERGDVIVFHYPPHPEESFIKRVIGKPGDRLRIERGWVYLNGRKLAEPYVPPVFREQRSMPEIVVPENEYFVMGDHRNISYDSRDFGAVAREFIYGKAELVYWPARDAGVVK